MRIQAPSIALLTMVLAAVPALAESRNGPPPDVAAADRCVGAKPGNPRVSAGIGILFEPEVPRELVVSAVGHWTRCRGYGSDFPPFLIGRPGTQTVEVKFETTCSRTPRCGSFAGRTIVLYAFATDRQGRIRSCGSRADGLAHELGHLLGLADAPRERGCFDHAMAPVDVTDRNRREIQPAECEAVGERWLTASELEPSGEAIAIAAVPGG